jgi:Na+-driven multidrug efflux pump
MNRQGSGKQSVFSDREFNHKLFTLALPMSLQSLMLSAVAACDAIMLGRLDQNSMSAVSLAGQIQFIQNIFLWAATGAASVLGAQYWGKGDRKAMDVIFLGSASGSPWSFHFCSGPDAFSSRRI